MKRKIIITFMLLLVAALAFPTIAGATRTAEGGRGDGPVIYVRSQDLFYDSIVTADPLPWEGDFQKLEMGPNGLETDLGPGDPGFLGGRWWLDVNGNGYQDANDHYFECPLLGPGRATP